LTNWWLLKQLFKNPFGCVKIVFLDSRLIQMMAKKVGKDPEWSKYRPFLKHVRGHRDHFHARIGEAPGEPGCKAGSITDDEVEDMGDEGDEYTDQIELSTIPQADQQSKSSEESQEDKSE
jgi:murein endopeptidase